jgi:hypothetical protein
MGKYYDRKRSEVPSWKAGDLVWLDGRHIKSKVASKELGPKMYGPFELVEMVGKNAARLKLPRSWRCHDVFNVSLLEPYRRSQKFSRPEDHEAIGDVEAERYGDDAGEYEVEAILASTRNNKKQLQYLVKWQGYPINESTWEPWENVQGSRELVLDLHHSNPDSRTDARVKRLVDAS